MLYREDYQLRTAWASNPSGYYYWTNVYYWQADSPDEYDLARDEVEQWVDHAHNPVVQRSRVQIREWPSGVLVQNTGVGNSPCFGPTATPLAINNTVLVWLLTGNGRMGYKRVRVPVGLEQVNGARLSADYLDYLNTSAHAPWRDTNHQCLEDGTPIVDFRVDEWVRVWQWRHGTKRQQRILLS